MPVLSHEMEELYSKALDELFALGRNLPRGSFRLMAEKYEIKEYSLRAKYWKRTDEKPSPFLRAKGIIIGDIRFESNPFQIEEAINLLIRRLNTAEDKNRSLQADFDRLIVAVKPKPPLWPIFQVATTKEGSVVRITNGPPGSDPESPACFWWRRGRVELPVQRRQTQDILQA